MKETLDGSKEKYQNELRVHGWAGGVVPSPLEGKLRGWERGGRHQMEEKKKVRCFPSHWIIRRCILGDALTLSPRMQTLFPRFCFPERWNSPRHGSRYPTSSIAHRKLLRKLFWTDS